MKKMFFSTAFFVAVLSSYAQEQPDGYNARPADVLSVTTYSHGDSPAFYSASLINAKAVKSLLSRYTAVENPEWFALKDKGWLCLFHVKGILNRAYYNKRGNWVYTFAGYGEEQLPKEIKDLVKRAYYDSSIRSVFEIDAPGQEHRYIVQLIQDNLLKIVHVYNEEITEQEVLHR